MLSVDLNHVSPVELQQHLTSKATIIACLCADWCDVCKAYRPKFDALAEQYPALLFLWIDIEDQASLVDHLEVDNFPTLLIQQQDIVTFYGTMLPDTAHLKRQIDVLCDKSPNQLRQLANTAEQQRDWQSDANIRARLAAHV
jgi:thiol-disulfide isomerase/thioredoxin